jgi:group I intron endonuclease
MNQGEIYKISCPRGKVYIGQCVSYLSNGTKYGTHGRWINHLSDARRKNGGNCRLLNKAIREHGENAFSIQVLLTTHTSLLDFYEETIINLLETTNADNGYNLRAGGNHSRLSEQTKLIMSNNRKLKPCFSQAHSQKTKDQISQTLIQNTVRLNYDGRILPKYVKYIDWKDRVGYAIVSHPKCKLKYFVSLNCSLEEQYFKCVEYLQQLQDE